MGELLRIATAGSVDDGKSTLIGRLLFDLKMILEDQLDAVERSSWQRGEQRLNLALLTDGLRAERAQGITIDVAHRYFATPQRKFIIADTPGHIQYTRNMVTGASTADVAMILIDARAGVLEQSRRHALLASLLGIPHVVVCVNKMDLVDYSAERFDEICEEFRRFMMKLELADLSFVPVSALHGHNVVYRSDRMPWYEGTSLLHHLEELHIASDRNLVDARLPVQYVIRPEGAAGERWRNYRGYAGTIAGGVFKPGDEVTVLPSGFNTTVLSIAGPGGEVIEEAFAGQAVTISLADHLDISRGDMICQPGNRPHVGQDLDAMVCWLAEATTLSAGGRYALQHTTFSTRAVVHELDYRLDVNRLHRDTETKSLGLNEIGRIRLRTHRPLLFDTYRRNRQTGSFILIDEKTNNTVAAGMITAPAVQESHIVWHGTSVSREEHVTTGMTVWLTGLSASARSSIAAELERRLVAAGKPVYVLDGHNVRHGLNSDLGFNAADQRENVRRVGEVAKLMANAGITTIVSLISPYRADRDRVRAIHTDAGLPFYEVFVDTPLPVCEAHDPKGRYAKARAGEITGFTGVDRPYEAPRCPDLLLRPSDGEVAAQAAAVLKMVDH